MGYDISNHPVDVQFIVQRLVPAITERRDLSDFFERAAQHAVVAHRAKQWALRANALSSAIFDRQLAVTLKAPDAMLTAQTGIWSRLRSMTFGTAPARRLQPTTGLPGFDSDLSVWGRPYFVTAKDSDEALRVVERYMACSSADLETVDAIASAEFDRLETRRADIRADVAPEAVAQLAEFYPLRARLPAADAADQPLDVPSVRAHLAAQLDLLQTIWSKHGADTLIDHPLLDEPAPGRELALALPQAVIGIAAQALPGWMGRGTVWPSALFKKIGEPIEHVFETPAPLFGALLRELPDLNTRLSTTIRDNYSLGGYVRPEKIGTLKELLLKHRRDLILAWSQSKSSDECEVEAMSADFTKILEPVLWAERHNYGFVEAAEVYSGFMGVMN